MSSSSPLPSDSYYHGMLDAISLGVAIMAIAVLSLSFFMYYGTRNHGHASPFGRLLHSVASSSSTTTSWWQLLHVAAENIFCFLNIWVASPLEFVIMSSSDADSSSYIHHLDNLVALPSLALWVLSAVVLWYTSHHGNNKNSLEECTQVMNQAMATVAMFGVVWIVADRTTQSYGGGRSALNSTAGESFEEEEEASVAQTILWTRVCVNVISCCTTYYLRGLFWQAFEKQPAMRKMSH